MSILSTPRKRLSAALTNSHTHTPTSIQTPTHPSSRIKFRADGSIFPDPNPIKLTSPIPTNTPASKPLPTKPTDIDLNTRLTTLLNRFFSPLNDENVFLRTLGKLAPETELDVLGDVDAWRFLEGEQVSREKKMWLVEVYGVFDKQMRVVLMQAGTYY